MLIVNAMIATFNEDNEFIENGYIRVERGIICDYGTLDEMKNKIARGELKIQDKKEILDAQGKLVMPGLICTHTHLYAGVTRGMPNSQQRHLEKRPLGWEIEQKLQPEEIYYSALVSLMEGIKQGVTCVFDHHSSSSCIEGSLDWIEKAFETSGMRGVISYEVSDKEGITTALKGIRENARFLEKSRQIPDSKVKGMFGLHAAFALPSKTLEIASLEGNRFQAGFHIHVGAVKEDLLNTRVKFQKGVLEYLKEYNLLNHKSIFADCIYIEDTEKEFLREMNVVHNPEVNMIQNTGYCDAFQLMNKGAIVGLGMDGMNLNLWRGMSTAYALHRFNPTSTTLISPKEIVKMGIRNNAAIASKFFQEGVGQIKRGTKADLIFAEYNPPTPIEGKNIMDHIVLGIDGSHVTHTIINGELLMKEKQLCHLDEKEIYRKNKEIVMALWAR